MNETLKQKLAPRRALRGVLTRLLLQADVDDRAEIQQLPEPGAHVDKRPRLLETPQPADLPRAPRRPRHRDSHPGPAGAAAGRVLRRPDHVRLPRGTARTLPPGVSQSPGLSDTSTHLVLPHLYFNISISLVETTLDQLM